MVSPQFSLLIILTMQNYKFYLLFTLVYTARVFIYCFYYRPSAWEFHSVALFRVFTTQLHATTAVEIFGGNLSEK